MCRIKCLYFCYFLLCTRYEDKLPRVDIFVCTADPKAEPPMLVINTVLSTMAYNYPTQKLSVYLSDDGGSEFTFYALLEASSFSKHWLPFCKKFKVEPRSPAAYFARNSDPQDTTFAQQHLAIKVHYCLVHIKIIQKSQYTKCVWWIRNRDLLELVEIVDQISN